MRIGIDVGGTNTDAVLMEGSTVVAWHKATTTADVTGGIVAALDGLLAQAAASAAEIEAVMIGTTHFVNAVTERRRLLDVACIRLSLPAATVIPPMTDWPAQFGSALGENVYFAHGGYNFDGRPISPLDYGELHSIARDIRLKGIRSVAITSAFAPVNDEMEHLAAAVFAADVPDAFISISSTIGRIGLLERENATILNASLREVARSVVQSLRRALEEMELAAPFYVTQNDGTLMQADYAQEYPILTFASGPTNSMRGAGFLSGATDALVADIGGTTTDVGVLVSGYPREASAGKEIAGVRTNFRMPDLVSIGLGGGSLVHRHHPGGPVTIGPQSVGYELASKAIVFGGDVLTATDIAVASGAFHLGDPLALATIDEPLVRDGLRCIHEMVADAVDRVKSSAQPMPLILVGGGASLICDQIGGASSITRPDNWAVANAVGAAIAQIGGEIDHVFSLEKTSRESALDDACRQAKERAIAAGARSGSVSIVEIDEVALTYLPGNATRIRVKAVGDLDLHPGISCSAS